MLCRILQPLLFVLSVMKFQWYALVQGFFIHWLGISIFCLLLCLSVLEIFVEKIVLYFKSPGIWMLTFLDWSSNFFFPPYFSFFFLILFSERYFWFLQPTYAYVYFSLCYRSFSFSKAFPSFFLLFECPDPTPLASCSYGFCMYLFLTF